MTDLVFATGNAHKVEEVQAILGDHYKVKSLKDIGIEEDIVEDGTTMEENALIKARYVYQKTGKSVFSEDSGLEVMALNMAPGLYTARYAGPQKNNEDNMDLLLKNMESVHERQARYRAVIAYIDTEGREYTFEGLINGRIAQERMGTGGFGYDPIFIPFGYEQSFGQLPGSLKNSISHRARAMARFLKHLKR